MYDEFKTGCASEAAPVASCEPYSHQDICCPPVSRVARSVCAVKFPVPACVPDPRNGCDPCDCVPCFDDELALSVEAKAAVVTMLEALRQSMSPVDRCGCDEISQVGHDIPLKPRQKQDPDTGAFLFQQVNADGSVSEVESAVGPSGAANQPLFDDLCCGATGNQHSAFLNSGISTNRFKGGNPPSLFGGMSGGVGSAEFNKRVGDLFCCAIAKVLEAPELVIAPVEEPVVAP